MQRESRARVCSRVLEWLEPKTRDLRTSTRTASEPQDRVRSASNWDSDEADEAQSFTLSQSWTQRHRVRLPSLSILNHVKGASVLFIAFTNFNYAVCVSPPG